MGTEGQMIKTPQMEQWASDFGRQYTDRNALSSEQLDALNQSNYGITRRQLNARFLKDIPADARILEVGCNMGNQLLLLREMGFRNLYGLDVQSYALERARSRLNGVCLVQATAFEIPYPDGFFDLVFTAGVLIHIAPDDLPRATAEIYRCTNSYIWGSEYHSPEAREVTYRGHQSLMWKMDYVNFYLEHFGDLELLLNQRLPYLANTNEDCMFLLRKRTVSI